MTAPSIQAKSAASTARPAEPTAKPLSPRERRFVMLFSEGVNGTQAYLQAYRCKENSAQVGASRLRRRPEISAAIEAEAKSRLASMLPKAVGRLDQLIDATSEKVSLEAVKATLDRTGVPSQRSDRAGSGNGLAVTINIRSGHAGQRDEVITITAPQQDE